MDALTLDYDPDTSGHSEYGTIGAQITAEGWSGDTYYAAAPDEFAAFIAGLCALPAPQPLTLIIGGEFQDGPLIRLDVVQTSPRGLFRVDVTLVDCRDRRRRLSTDIATDYAAMAAFGQDLKRILRLGGEAVLQSRGN
jgi:hypothetical protein